jgi:hypothetical protein
VANRTSKLVVVVAALLLTVLASYPYELANITDSTCITLSTFTACEGSSGHGCASTNFFVEHTDTYTLTASIDNCSGNNCTGCVSEAYLYEGTTLLLCVHSGCCGEVNASVTLVTGHTYTLYCCLLPCERGGNCVSDCANCPARATLHS